MRKFDWGHVPLGRFVAGFDVRKMLIGLLFITLFWKLTAFPKERETARPIPLFIDPEFSFSQVGTICLAPALDLRSKATYPLALSVSGPKTPFFGRGYIPGADRALAEDFKRGGYQTAACNRVSATLSDLTTPSDTWLRKLDFGQSDWLFVLAVEDVCPSCMFGGRTEVTQVPGYAVVSGFLFQRRTDAIRMVWRDRTAGILIGNERFAGPKETVETGQGTLAVDNGVLRLVEEFEWRSPKRPQFLFAVDDGDFSANCDVVWDKLKDALNNHAKEYKVTFLDASDRMALYFDHHGTFMEDHVVLNTHGDTCVAQVTQSFEANARQTDHWSELVREVRASLPNQ